MFRQGVNYWQLIKKMGEEKRKNDLNVKYLAFSF